MPRHDDVIAEARRQWEAAGWADAAPGMAAVTSVMRAQQIYQAAVDEVLKPFDLTFARYELLMLLMFSSRGSLPLKIASQRLQVHPTSVTNAVDRLANADLVERLPHPTDGRGTLVSLTEDGRRVALKATEALNAAVFAQPGLAPRRVETLLSVLEDLRRSAGDL
jgi:DNA-binding MarR family transcriptional regulator